MKSAKSLLISDPWTSIGERRVVPDHEWLWIGERNLDRDHGPRSRARCSLLVTKTTRTAFLRKDLLTTRHKGPACHRRQLALGAVNQDLRHPPTLPRRRHHSQSHTQARNRATSGLCLKTYSSRAAPVRAPLPISTLCKPLAHLQVSTSSLNLRPRRVMGRSHTSHRSLPVRTRITHRICREFRDLGCTHRPRRTSIPTTVSYLVACARRALTIPCGPMLAGRCSLRTTQRSVMRTLRPLAEI